MIPKIIFMKLMHETIFYESLKATNKPFIEEYKRIFAEILDSGWFILGNNVSSFENEFSEYLGADHCVGVASGLDALVIALQVCKFPKGSEVLVPSNTYIATILSIVNQGLVPVLVEPDIRTYNIDPGGIEAKITTKTRAIMPVHLYGKCCDMDQIMEIARRHNMRVIEDCAQSHGASLNGKKTGTFGDFGAFSFYPTKNLGALGDGGALCMKNEEDYETAKTIRNYGSKKRYYNELIGVNSRLDEIQAGFLRIKLNHLDQINEHKRKLAAIYFEQLNDECIKPVIEPGFFDVFHIYNIRTEQRDELKTFLLENNIHCDIHYPVSPNKQIAMKGILDHIKTPISEEIHKTTLSLPVSYGHTADDIYRVCEVINKFFLF